MDVGASADAGVADEDVGVAVGLDAGVEEALAVLHLGNVARDVGDLAAGGLDLVDDLLGLLDTAGDEDDLGALLAEQAGDALADARRRASDDCDLAIQNAHADLLDESS